MIIGDDTTQLTMSEGVHVMAALLYTMSVTTENAVMAAAFNKVTLALRDAAREDPEAWELLSEEVDMMYRFQDEV